MRRRQAWAEGLRTRWLELVLLLVSGLGSWATLVLSAGKSGTHMHAWVVILQHLVETGETDDGGRLEGSVTFAWHAQPCWICRSTHLHVTPLDVNDELVPLGCPVSTSNLSTVLHGLGV